MVMVAPDEWAAGKVKIREMATGEEREVAASEWS
jgi:histidyl-tRNA synthetase